MLPPRILSWKMMGQAGELLKDIEMDEAENFSQATIDKFKSDPAFYRSFVKKLEKEVNSTFPIVSTRLPPAVLPRLITFRPSRKAPSRRLRGKRSRST